MQRAYLIRAAREPHKSAGHCVAAAESLRRWWSLHCSCPGLVWLVSWLDAFQMTVRQGARLVELLAAWMASPIVLYECALPQRSDGVPVIQDAVKTAAATGRNAA